MVPLPQGSGPVLNPFRPGNIISGKYEVVGLIGDGGMGFVVAAKHLELGENVALKFLKPDALRNPEVVARFAREARASVRIKSEYVARVFDVGSMPDGSPFIVMEHLDGEDLASVLEKRGALPVKLAVEYMMQVCEALAAAHALGIVHRDIKPENLFLTRRSQGLEVVKVLDFGISKVALTGSAFETDMPMVRTMLPMGSPIYMSPEQIRAQEVDPRSDIWSLGCVLYELLTGATAFDAPSITQLSAIILEQNPTPIRTLLPEASAELEAVVERCLQKNPDERYQSVADLAIALYPFAPRRARISAERCSYMLHGHAVSPADFELLSVPPPGNADASGSQPHVAIPRSTTPRIATPHSTDERATGTRPTSSSPAAARRTSSSIPTLTPGEFEPRPRSKNLKYVLFAALGAALLAGAYGATRLTAKSEPAASAPVAVPAARQPAGAKAAEPVDTAPAERRAAPAATAAAAGATAQSGSDAGGAIDKAASKSAPRRTYAAPAPRRPIIGRPSGTRHSEEVDVGF